MNSLLRRPFGGLEKRSSILAALAAVGAGLGGLLAGCAQPSAAQHGFLSQADAGAPDGVAVSEPKPDAGTATAEEAGAGLDAPDAGGQDAADAAEVDEEAICGNGIQEAGEDCDGVDFGGKTCESVGLGGGLLQCNAFCGILVTGCTAKELCSDGYDNDDDFLTDCDDPECSSAAYCSDGCAAMELITTLPAFEYSDTEGKPSTISPSCSTTSGPEAVFEFTATDSEELRFSLSGDSVSLSVRTDCAKPSSELACVNDDTTGYYESEKLTLTVSAGKKYYVIVDSESGPGFFDLSIDPPPKEYDCTDLYDDDGDGALDCDDSDCDGDAGCTSGSKAVGQACVTTGDCASSNSDPICLTSKFEYTGGYCSEFCKTSSDCPGDGICVDLGVSTSGVCLDGCAADGDCRTGYQCLDRGGSKVCSPPTEADCTNLVDDDGDGDVDCRDSNCSVMAICQPGSGNLGDPCTQPSDCGAWVGDDPICLTGGFNGGYCSEHCNVACDTDGACISYLPGGGNICFKLCDSSSDCRSGYTCTAHTIFEKVCTP